MVSTRRCLGWLILASVIEPPLGHAAMVDSDGDCPSGADVDSALAQLLRAGSGSSAAVTVRDLGTNWTVQVAGRSATYSDPDRNCLERTRIAAVFAALVLEPPDVGDPSPAPPKRESAGSAQPRQIRAHRLALAPEFLVAPGAGQAQLCLDLGWILALAGVGGALRSDSRPGGQLSGGREGARIRALPGADIA